MRHLLAAGSWLFVFSVAVLLLLVAPRHSLGKPCRVIEQTVTISGVAVLATGTVCPQLGGRWGLARWPVRDRLASPD